MDDIEFDFETTASPEEHHTQQTVALEVVLMNSRLKTKQRELYVAIG